MPFEIPTRPGQFPAHTGQPLLGPAANDLVELPYPELKSSVSVRWVAVHSYRERGDGTREPIWQGVVQRAYRARFTLGWTQLESNIAGAVAAAVLTDGPTWFAPYSDEDRAPFPQAFQVNVLSDVPDEDDMITGRRPIVLEMESVRVWTVSEGVPIRGANMTTCGVAVASGVQGVTETQHYMGSRSGLVRLDYQAFSNPDAFELIYEGEVVASTGGLVSDTGTLEYYYLAHPDHSSFITVRVDAPNVGTGWEYLLNCPDTNVDPPDGGSDVDVPDAPENLVGATDGDDAVWTWDPVAGADGYFLRWGTEDGGPYPNVVFIVLSDLADGDAPEWTIEGAATGDVTTYAVVSTWQTIE